MLPEPVPYVYRAKVLSAYDGDTLNAEIDLGLSVSIRAACRLFGLDTPEIRGPSEYEKSQAIKARDRLRELTLDKWVTLQSLTKPDKYGRLLIKLWVPEGYVNDILVSEGLAKSYDGGQRVPWVAPKV